MRMDEAALAAQARMLTSTGHTLEGVAGDCTDIRFGRNSLARPLAEVGSAYATAMARVSRVVDEMAASHHRIAGGVEGAVAATVSADHESAAAIGDSGFRA